MGLYRRFFKIILQTFIEQKKLRIPLKFVKNYGNELGDVAQLTVLDGQIWKVKVKKDEDDHIWFENGFYEFAKHYSICHGYLLTFQYKGMSNFSVIIHDNSGCEMNYPPHQPEIRTEDVNASGFATRQRKFEFASELKNPEIDSSGKNKDFECGSEGKRCKIQEVVDLTGDSDDQDNNSEKGNDRSGLGSGQESEIFVASNFDEIESKLSPESKRALNEARKYKPKNHGFMVVTRASHYRDRSRMDVPLAFVEKYRHKITGNKIKVQISDEKQWQKDFVISMEQRTLGGLLLTKGWSSFVNDNLELGDVCVFELMNSEKFMFKAIIFQACLE
ncbi:AP2/B3-like transcriptional factor family protein [Euphorbia peplus]|nr:AP2/B3-like transcriptional factor family protein [Euphorbia peplus]